MQSVYAALLVAAMAWPAGASGQAAGQPVAPRWTIPVGELQLTLEPRRDGVRLLSLLDTVTRQELLAPKPMALMELKLRLPGTDQQVAMSAEAGWGSVELRASDDRRQIDITWRDPKQAEPGTIRVTARLTLNPADSSLHWKLAVENRSPTWSCWRLVFPQLALAEPGPPGKLFLPRGPGEVQQGVWQRGLHYQELYPNSAAPMQFLAVFAADRRTGLYVAAHDPAANAKELAVRSRPQEGSVVFTFDQPVPDMGRPGNSWSPDGEVVWQLLRGDWYDAARRYADWARREARWMPRLAEEARGDTSDWMRTLPAWTIAHGKPEQCEAAVRRFAERLGVPLGFHWYSWHQIPFDNDYPHYFPPQPGFTEAVRRLQASGVRVMPYINGRLWDTRDRGGEDWQFSQVALPAATKDPAGKPYLESYGSKESDGQNVRLAAMCPGAKLWQERVAQIVRRLFEEHGVDGVYIDQVAAAPPQPCFDPSHGHPLGGGNSWTAGYGRMLEEIRRQMPPGKMLTTECNAEPYVKWFDGYLTWHWQHDGQVPAFPAVYGGAIQMFGRAYRGGATKDRALAMKAGQQLVFGEQIGWLEPSVVDEADNFAFLRQIVRLRWALRRYFEAGRMARPPALANSVESVTADWQWSGQWPVTTPAVLTGAWQLARERRAVVLLVNVSERPAVARVPLGGKELGLGGAKLALTPLTAEGRGQSVQVDATTVREATLPPRSALAWELTPGD